MVNAALVAFPIAVIEHLSVVMWRDPSSAGVRWTGPVTGVPFVMVSDGIPITRNPSEIGSRPRRRNANHPRRRRRSYSDSNGNLSAEYRSGTQKHRHEKCCRHETLRAAVLLKRVPCNHRRSRSMGSDLHERCALSVSNGTSAVAAEQSCLVVIVVVRLLNVFGLLNSIQNVRIGRG